MDMQRVYRKLDIIEMNILCLEEKIEIKVYVIRE